MDVRIVALAVLACVAGPVSASPHVVQIEGLLPDAEEGLLLGNGDLSCSVWPKGDELVFRLGKGDVWDRRLAYNDGVRPATLAEYRNGILHEGWKRAQWGLQNLPVATKGTKDEKRMREIVTGVAPNLHWYPYPCPKPTGDFRLMLPCDLPGPMKVFSRLYVEEGRVTVDIVWRNGVKLFVEAVIAPDDNILSVDWRLDGWNEETRYGNEQNAPVWYALSRHRDPDFKPWRAKRLANQKGTPGRACSREYKPLPPPVVDGNAIEQVFYPDGTFPDGFRYKMWLHTDWNAGRRYEPSPEDKSGATVFFRPKAGSVRGEAQVVIRTSSDPVYAPPGMAKRRHADYRAAAVRAAAAYWSESGFSVPGDPFLENVWYALWHARRCILKPGTVPPGLFFPSTVKDFSWWHGDYHSNYNVQSIYWGDFTANRLDDARTYFDMVERWLAPIGRKIARDYYGCRGVFFQLEGFPTDAEDDVNGSIALGRMAYMTGWMMTRYWEYYAYTRDRDWLAKRGYPIIRDCALFYLDFLLKAPHPDLPECLNDGLYHAFPSNAGESQPDGNPMTLCDCGQVLRHARFSLWAAIEAANVLDVDAELRGQWQDRLDHLAKTRHDLAGYEKHCYLSVPPEFSDGGCPYVEPPDYVGEPAPRPPRDAWYYGHMILRRIGVLRDNRFVPGRDFPEHRKTLEDWTHPNGLIWAMAISQYGRAGAWTETLSAMAPFQEMALQSWDGAIRLFPWWPKDRDVAFSNWRAQGAFLVTASLANGRPTDVSVVSEKGEDCLMHGDWLVYDKEGKDVPTDRDPFGRLRFKTVAGGRYSLVAR